MITDLVNDQWHVTPLPNQNMSNWLLTGLWITTLIHQLLITNYLNEYWLIKYLFIYQLPIIWSHDFKECDNVKK